jgi:site-specific DNA recombinase
VHEYVDNDVSASKGVRPQFQEMLRTIRTGSVDTIIAWHTDRLYRRNRDSIEVLDLAENYPLLITTVRSGDMDLRDPSGRMVAGMLGGVARYEVEQKSLRQKAANQQRAKNGVWQFSARPWGYDRTDGVITINEDEAAIIRDVIQRYIDGDSWYGIAQKLNAQGIITQTGHKWTNANLRQRVTNPAYAGIRKYLGEVASDEGQWPPIIDRDLWDRFETILINRAGRRPWSSKLKYFGSGIYVCGKCGEKMIGAQGRNRDKGVYSIYSCKNLHLRRKQAPVDELVEIEVLARLSMPDVLRALTPSEDVALLATRSQEIRERIDGLAELYADGVLTAIQIREQKARLQGQLDDLQARMNAYEGGSALAGIVSSTDVVKHWHEKVSVEDKRKIIDTLLTVTIMPVKQRGGRGGSAFDPTEILIVDRMPNE